MASDAFANCHPATNAVFFAGAIGFTVVLQHPLYIAASCVAGATYYLLLKGRRGMGMVLGLIPVFAVLSLVNPLFNTYGQRVLFTVWGNPYTLEALCYGMAIAGMFAAMMLWFGCYSAVLTSDKFICLFGRLIPAISLLLVMVLRMIPNLQRRARQILGARAAIGKGISGAAGTKEKVAGGMRVLSALTDWALEGGIVTGDSMRSRGYGSGKRTSFRLYRMTVQDWALMAAFAALAAATILAGGTEAAYTPTLSIAAPGWGLAAYGLYLLLPSMLHGKETLQWFISISKI